jgi:mannose-6-phosphate isomerase-like protein (cupin superfamily)
VDVTAFIRSGVLETYILGFASEQESREVENMAALYPEVKQALESTRASMRSYITSNALPPSPGLKTSIMKGVYRQESVLNRRYVPLLSETTDWDALIEAIDANNLNEITPSAGNLFAYALPSTPTVTNFAVWVNTGHEEESHDDFDEYIAIIKGSCVMYFRDKARNYKEGDIIFIPPNVPHKAVITSPGGMFALVQRQAI